MSKLELAELPYRIVEVILKDIKKIDFTDNEKEDMAKKVQKLLSPYEIKEK